MVKQIRFFIFSTAVLMIACQHSDDYSEADIEVVSENCPGVAIAVKQVREIFPDPITLSLDFSVTSFVMTHEIYKKSFYTYVAVGDCYSGIVTNTILTDARNAFVDWLVDDQFVLIQSTNSTIYGPYGDGTFGEIEYSTFALFDVVGREIPVSFFSDDCDGCKFASDVSWEVDQSKQKLHFHYTPGEVVTTQETYCPDPLDCHQQEIDCDCSEYETENYESDEQITHVFTIQ